MKVKVTITGILDLAEEDFKALKKVNTELAMQALLADGQGIKVKVEKGKEG